MSSLALTHPFQALPSMEEEARFAWTALRVLCLVFGIDPTTTIEKRQKGAVQNVRASWLYSMKSRISSKTMSHLLGYDRSTVEDDQNMTERWAFTDEKLHEQVETVVDLMDPLRSFVGFAPDMLERMSRYREQDQEAKRLAREEAKQAKAIAAINKLEKRLSKGGEPALERMEETLRDTRPNWQSLMVPHWGPKETVNRLSPRAVTALVLLFVAETKKEDKDRRVVEGMIGPSITEELIRFGLARRSTLLGEGRVVVTMQGQSVVTGAKLKTRGKSAPVVEVVTPSVSRRAHPMIAVLQKERSPVARALGPIVEASDPPRDSKGRLDCTAWASVEESKGAMTVTLCWAGSRDTLNEAIPHIVEAYRQAGKIVSPPPSIFTHPTIDKALRLAIRVGANLKPSDGRQPANPPASR